MGKALEIITGQALAPGAVITEIGMSAGNSATIRNTPIDAMIRLLSAWTLHQAVGLARIRSPKLHDNVQGIRLDATVGDPKPLLPKHFSQRLYPQDELILEVTGSAVVTEYEIMALLLAYDNLPGINARFITKEQMFASMKHLLSVENTIATGVVGGWSGEEAIDAEFDLLKANTDYALLGYLVDVQCAAVRWRGSDFGNLGLGGPGDELGRDYTRSYFIDLAEEFGAPWIPVFNSANKGNLLVDVHQDEAGTDVTVTSLLAELEPGAAPPVGGTT